MATRAAVPVVAGDDARVLRYRWTGLLNGDDGAPIEKGSYADRSVQVLGTFGAGGSISIEGSNDGGTTWAVLKDPLGNAVTFTSAGIKTIGDVTFQTRPHVTAGDGTTSLAVHILARKTE